MPKLTRKLGRLFKGVTKGILPSARRKLKEEKIKSFENAINRDIFATAGGKSRAKKRVKKLKSK